jgi:hypothetical protein
MGSGGERECVCGAGFRFEIEMAAARLVWGFFGFEICVFVFGLAASLSLGPLTFTFIKVLCCHGARRNGYET